MDQRYFYDVIRRGNMEIALRKFSDMGPGRVPCITRGPLGAAESAGQGFKPEEIDALVAPIALYPDELLSQIFMASTYPLEVVEASRWAKQNKNLKGDASSSGTGETRLGPQCQVARELPRRAVQHER